ncbi:ComF family protein [Colwelliaceae bacterium 6441]
MELDKASQLNFLARLKNKLIERFSLTRFSLSECELCQSKPLIHPMLCQHCKDDLPLFTYQHLHDNLLNWPAIDKLFPDRKFDKLLCLAPYVFPIDHWLKQLKYQQRFEIADLLGFLLAQLWNEKQKTHNDAALLAVPIHIKKWQQRGFNQAHLIAKAFAKHTQLPYLKKALYRVTFNQSQVGQSGKARRQHLKGAFILGQAKEILPETIILLDDVITTGTTTNTICRLLKKEGVKHITVLTVSLSLPQ